MGARAFVRRRLLEGKRDGFDIEYIGRGYRASPSEGYAGQHAVEQERIVTTALVGVSGAKRSPAFSSSSSISDAADEKIARRGPKKPSRDHRVEECEQRVVKAAVVEKSDRFIVDAQLAPAQYFAELVHGAEVARAAR